jgi:peptidoglycan/LPS O-acetylase OafA/YrhL
MKYFWGLDLIRFLSAVMVVLFHIYAFGGAVPSWPVDPGNAPLSWLEPASWMGWVGVQIFFVISGFVIAASARGSSGATFLKKRAIRVLPALWISATLALLVRALWGEPLGELFSAFLRTLVLSPKGPYIDGVVWTLVVEAVFYLSTAVVILMSSRFGEKEKNLNDFTLLLGGCSTAFTLLYWIFHSTHILVVGSGTLDYLNSFAFDVLLLRQGVFFALGMLLYRAVYSGTEKKSFLIIAIFSLGCILQIYNNVGEALMALVPAVIWAIATCLIYFGAMYGDKLIKTNVRPIMRPIGLMTYPLYLNHFILGQALLPALALWISNSVLLCLVLLAILLANAWLIAQYPERWIQQQLKRTFLKEADLTRTVTEKVMV